MTLGVVSDPTAEEMRAQPQSAPEDLLGLPGNGPQHGKIDTQEHVAKLRGAQWHRLVIEMLRSSPSIATVSRELMSYLMSATWSVEGGRDDIADFWREALGLEGRAGRMTTTFERALRGLAYALNGGFAYSEEMYYHADGRVWLDRLEWRDPRSHYRWITDQRGQVAGVEQWVTDASGRQWQTVIPVDRTRARRVGRRRVRLRRPRAASSAVVALAGSVARAAVDGGRGRAAGGPGGPRAARL